MLGKVSSALGTRYEPGFLLLLFVDRRRLILQWSLEACAVI